MLKKKRRKFFLLEPNIHCVVIPSTGQVAGHTTFAGRPTAQLHIALQGCSGV